MAEATNSSCGDIVAYTVTAAVVAGQVVQLPDGRAGIAVDGYAAGSLGHFHTEGIFTVAKTASMVMLPGSELFWDHSADAASLLFGNDKDYFLGACVDDAASAATTVKVNLNKKPQATISFADGFVNANVQTAGFPSISGAGDSVNMAFTTTAEAQKVDALSIRGISPSADGIVHMLICINTNSDASAGDLNFGLANGTHATDADSITESLFIHVDGGSANINAESDDGTTEVASTDTTVDFTAGTPFLAQWDLRNNEDIQLYINGVNVLPSSVFKLNAATGPLKLLAHMEKTSDDSPGNVTVRGFVTTFDPGTVS